MTTYQKFRKLKIDFRAIGLELTGKEEKYFCTPKGARMIASAGVDGIHYCFVRGKGEMVFAISPMNCPGQNVHPIALTFEDLLRLLLACGSMDALEQAWQWDEEEFEEYVEANPPGPEALEAFVVLKEKLGITPMENPYQYLEEVGHSWWHDLDFPTEYYEILQAQPPMEVPSEWKVTMEGGFYPMRGKAGRELTLQNTFTWGDEIWHVPAVYVCSGGMVADFCIQIHEERWQKYYEKVKLLEAAGYEPSRDKELELRRENPVANDFRAALTVNGERLTESKASGRAWIPDVGDGDQDMCRYIMDHYGLDSDKLWIFRRVVFPWEGRRNLEVESLQLHLKRDTEEIPGAFFCTPKPGDTITLNHPMSGKEHVLTVRECREDELAENLFRNADMEYPRKMTMLVYTVEPELTREQLRIMDCSEGDSPRYKDGRQGHCFAGAVAMYWQPEDTGAYLDQQGNPLKPQAAVSAMYFELDSESIRWCPVFHVKMMEDVDVRLV